MPGTHNPDESGPSPAARARALLLSHRSGILLLDELREHVHYAIDGRTGGIITSVPRHAAETDQWVMMVPEETDDALQVLLEHAEADESAHGPAMDRHQAMHGKPRWPCWRFATIASARLGGAVIEPEAVPLANPLVADEPVLVRALNADRAALGHACRAACGRDIADALAVGVDSLGIDVRTTFGVVRVPFAEEVRDVSAARQAIATLTRSGPKS